MAERKLVKDFESDKLTISVQCFAPASIFVINVVSCDLAIDQLCSVTMMKEKLKEKHLSGIANHHDLV